MANKIQFRRDTAANWSATNPVLLDGELGIEKSTMLFKIGDGVKPWNELAYSGSSSGTVNSLKLPSIPDPSAPLAGTMRIYGSEIAGRSFPKFMGPSGLSTSMQPLLARNKIGYWCPPGNAVTVPGVLGYTTTSTSGTLTLRTVTITNLFSRMRRLGYVSATTVGSVAGNRVAVAQVTLSDGNNVGGFFKVCRFGISDTVFVPSARMFVGVTASTAVPTNVDPSTLTNSIGIGCNSGDTTLKLYYGGSTAQVPIDLGPNFPCNTSNIDVYELALFAPPNSTGIKWQVTRLNTGHEASGTIENTNLGVTLPSSTTLLSYHHAYRSNGTAALAVGIDIMSDYIETDY